LLEKASGRLPTVEDEDRTEIIDLIEIIRDAGAAGDAAVLAQARDLLFYLET
jgi:hypothetical protein